MKKIYTYVAGTTYDNLDNKSRQDIISRYVVNNYDINSFSKDSGDYWSNKEIKEYDMDIYQYEMTEYDTVELVDDPENPYDKNAIMVIHKQMGLIGYIPKDDIEKVRKLYEENPHNISVTLKLFGGKYKYYDNLLDKVVTSSKPYYFDLIFTPRVYESIESDDTDSINKNLDIDNNNNNNNKKNKKQPSAKTYLISSIIFNLLFLFSLIFGSKIISIISLVIAIMYFKKYLKIKKWKELITFLYHNMYEEVIKYVVEG